MSNDATCGFVPGHARVGVGYLRRVFVIDVAEYPEGRSRSAHLPDDIAIRVVANVSEDSARGDTSTKLQSVIEVPDGVLPPFGVPPIGLSPPPTEGPLALRSERPFRLECPVTPSVASAPSHRPES